MLLIKPDDEATQGLADVPAARAYFDEYLPQFSGFISDAALASVIAKPPSRLPSSASPARASTAARRPSCSATPSTA